MSFHIRWLPMAVVLLLVVVGLPLAWLLATYLAAQGIPMPAAALIGLLVLPAVLVTVALAFPAVMSWRLRRRFARGQAELSNGWPAEDPDQMDPVDMMATGMQMQDLENGQLQRAIGVGEERAQAGVSVELLSIDIRDAGGIVNLRVRGSGAPFRSNPFEPHFPQPHLTLTDDAGTSYRVFPGGGGGGDGIYRFELRFVPAPPAEARRLSVRVTAFSDSLPY